MNFSDAQLADAVEFLWHQYCENLPDVSDYHPAYSADFLKKWIECVLSIALRER